MKVNAGDLVEFIDSGYWVNEIQGKSGIIKKVIGEGLFRVVIVIPELNREVFVSLTDFESGNIRIKRENSKWKQNI